MCNKLKSYNSQINESLDNKINIAILDSGITPNSCFFNYNNIIYGYKNNFPNFYDKHGHGTSVTYLIQNICKNSKIFIVKVFDDKLVTSPRIIINSIRWCIENNIKIINLSVAITNFINFEEINDICREAYKKNILIVASSHNLGKPCLPAYLENVFGVGLAKLDSKYDFMIEPTYQIQLYASGNSLKVISLNDEIQDVRGSSFATAIMTANIALLIKNDINITFKKVISILKCNSKKFDQDKIIYKNESFNYKVNCRKIKINNPIIDYVRKLQDIVLITTNIFDIYILSEYISLLKVNLKKIIYLGKNPDVILNSNKLKNCFISIDIKITEDILKYKNIILSPNFNFNDIVIKKNAFLLDIKYTSTLDYPMQFIDNIRSIEKNHIFCNEYPILSLINLGKISSITSIIELELIKLLKINNYNISNISSSILSQLFSSDYYYNDNLFVNLSHSNKIIFFKALLESIKNIKRDTDLIITSIDGGIKSIKPLSSYTFKSISNISILCSIVPCSVILIIDEFTNLQELLDSINIIKALIKNINIIIVSIAINAIYNDFLYDYDANKLNNDYILTRLKDMNINNISYFDFNDKENFKFILEKIKDYCSL